MRKIMIAALAAATLMPVAAPVAAGAQSYGEVRQDQRDVRQDRRDVRQDVRRGDYRDARGDRQDLRQDRQEVRGDWRDYRRAHPDFYRNGAYAAPRGYRYRPVTVGYRFEPTYYGRNYWVTDYNRYHLARPGYGQQWVRYGNDVVLINLRSGRVATVFNGFFF